MESKLEEFKQPSPFVRESRLRKSFRIKNRVKYNPKLTPAALIFMKSLDNKKINYSTPSSSLSPSTLLSTTYTLPTLKIANIEHHRHVNSNETSDESECSFECDDDRRKLINKQPLYRNYFKKFQKKKQLLDFFKKKC